MFALPTILERTHVLFRGNDYNPAGSVVDIPWWVLIFDAPGCCWDALIVPERATIVNYALWALRSCLSCWSSCANPPTTIRHLLFIYPTRYAARGPVALGDRMMGGGRSALLAAGLRM